MGKRETEPTDELRVEHRAFWLPKGGAAEAEYEDAFAVPGSASAPARAEGAAPFRAAVADGATEAVFSGRWARLLARRFVENGPPALGERLSSAQEAWAASVEVSALPWYAAAKAEAGAFAALLGLALRPPAGDRGRWQAAAVGDCNLFHLREGERVRAWPFAQASDFGNRPALVPSRAEAAVPGIRRAEGRFKRGDAFVLATDAAAAWLLRLGPAEALAWQDQQAFAETARKARASGVLKNDDATVLVLKVRKVLT